MQTFVALLRGVNVSGKKKVPMVVLKRLFEDSGFSKVATYINTGNVVFRAAESGCSQIAPIIEKRIEESFGFEVKVIVMGLHVLNRHIAACPFSERSLKPNEKIYLTILSALPPRKLIEKLKSYSDKTDEHIVSGKAVYLLAKRGYSETLFNNTFIEKVLKVDATTRNINTLKKIADIGRGVD